MLYIETSLAAEWYTACEVAPEPAAHDTGAPLAASCLEACPRLPFLCAVRTL